MKLKWQIYLIQLDVVFKTKGLIRNISVIQLSDRVYNVTFPAYDVYSLREYRS
jgi:hypothetical protein